MTTFQFHKLNGEGKELIDFYTLNKWEFHADPVPSKDEITKRYESGWFEDDKETFWIEEGGEKIGLIIISDISDTMPLLYDVRLANYFRSKGYGLISVKWAVDYVFSGLKDKVRLESYTRYDNYAMRKVFHKCHFEKEGYLRKSWENDDGTVDDAVVYSVIREDWEEGKKTPIKLNDVPF
ncbi:GNAT family N-acetyltransferase [Salipaludibacillus keqinensis]|uniref:GNAT family N-acetyltransferase n=1 Tax=Salipaludibacillus keqinensis TaxID=2045207 RepID=A0A323TIJ5_9BACI|nr:GNAT family protein [Salipaludibacillus keqinensis]PYZ93387.1 GNAT family N-acetyltransferase [Salipaludibacillus keqinensis]